MYYRMYGGLLSKLLLLTKSDAEHCARVLHEENPTHRYVAMGRMFGYEGADQGVAMYAPDDIIGFRFVEWVDLSTLREMCADRPIVPQSESWA